jgi:predicted metal-binding protein
VAWGAGAIQRNSRANVVVFVRCPRSNGGRRGRRKPKERKRMNGNEAIDIHERNLVRMILVKDKKIENKMRMKHVIIDPIIEKKNDR